MLPPKPTRRGRTRSVTRAAARRGAPSRAARARGRRRACGTRSAARARCPCGSTSRARPLGPVVTSPAGRERAPVRSGRARTWMRAPPIGRLAAFAQADGHRRPAPGATVRRCLAALREHRAQAPAALALRPVERAADERRDRRGGRWLPAVSVIRTASVRVPDGQPRARRDRAAADVAAGPGRASSRSRSARRPATRAVAARRHVDQLRPADADVVARGERDGLVAPARAAPRAGRPRRAAPRAGCCR